MKVLNKCTVNPHTSTCKDPVSFFILCAGRAVLYSELCKCAWKPVHVQLMSDTTIAMKHIKYSQEASSVSGPTYTPVLCTQTSLSLYRCCEPPRCGLGDAVWRNPHEAFCFLSTNHSPGGCQHHHHLYDPLCPSLLHGMPHPSCGRGLPAQVMGMTGEKIPFAKARAWIWLSHVFLSPSSTLFSPFH